MKRAILACIVVSACQLWCQQRDDRVVFEQRSSSTGVPFPWPSTWADVSSLKIDREGILRFLADLDRDDVPQMLAAIQSFRFVPLEKGKYYLVADTDVSGRGLFGSLEIVRCEGAACIVGNQPTTAEDLDTDLVDVNGDGVFAVITKELAGAYEGVATRPIYVYTIRSLLNGKLVDVSSKYAEYFKNHILPRMEADRKAIEAFHAEADKPRPVYLSELDGRKRLTPEEEESNRETALWNQRMRLVESAELQYVQDDYHRRILGEKTAGLENALKWARTDGLREFGIKALEPIDSPTAAAELLRIANSKDSSFAEDARNALNRRAQARLAPPPTGGAVK